MTNDEEKDLARVDSQPLAEHGDLPRSATSPCEHVWVIDVSAPVLDTVPPIYTLKCELCGAFKQEQAVQ